MTVKKTMLNYVSNDLSKACVLAAQTHSTIFGLIPFVETNGGMAHAYNVVNELIETGFRGINEQVTGDYVEPQLQVENLKILSADVIIDRIFALGRVGNLIDIKAEQTEIAIASMVSKFEQQFLYGTALGNEFKGVYPRLEEGVGKKFLGSLEMEMIDECLDYVRYAKGEIVMICSPKTKRQLSKVMRISNTVTSTVELFGTSVSKYDGVTVHVSEAVNDGEIFFINFNEAMGVTGITSGGLVANDQGFEGTQYRIGVEMVCGIAVKHHRAFAVLEIGSVNKNK